MKLILLSSIFHINKCKSSSLESYSVGPLPMVTSTELNNGVEKFIEPNENDEIIDKVPCITISGFGFAAVQTKPFLGAGNNGAYVKALIPKSKMSLMEIYFYAAQINLQQWRFSYGRLAIKPRVEMLKVKSFDIKEENIKKINKDISGLIIKSLDEIKS